MVWEHAVVVNHEHGLQLRAPRRPPNQPPNHKISEGVEAKATDINAAQYSVKMPSQPPNTTAEPAEPPLPSTCHGCRHIRLLLVPQSM